MSSNSSQPNDEFLDQSLARLSDDAAPVDRDAIAQAVTTAGDLFAQSVGTADESLPSPDADASSARVDSISSASQTRISLRVTPAPQVDSKGQGSMHLLIKPLAVLAAAIAALLFVVMTPDTVSADVTLGDVFDATLKSSGLQLEVTSEGRRSDVRISGDSIRWQDSADRYRIASGTRLWRVDESKNTVRSEENPWRDATAKQIDLLALVGSQSSGKLRNLEPAGQAEHAGTLCNVFTWRPEAGELIVRAYASARTNQLYSIACWTPDLDPDSRPPVSELRLVRRDLTFDESLFVAGDTLTVDGRVGKIAEAQGVVHLRPKVTSRWTPVGGPMVIKPGDWVRTYIRSANAASLSLSSRHRIVLGPGSLLEVVDPQQVILHRGEANFVAGRNVSGDLVVSTGPTADRGTMTIAAGDDSHVRVVENRLATVPQKPLWLRGFEGATADESIGALIARVDGKDVPLSVGEHNVTVEIRDQIARTTIVQTFENHTDNTLEGVFHFPLPQDASISGFGMWIGNNLTEADVVEKQRAREIYETILRERRDPGLLEWTGGNIFKARVFPIFAHSEKRIKITYTQVLPMRGNQYRYSYGLRSEMLQTKPLRSLSINVLVNSALRLKSVECPTHSVRSDLAAHAGSLEFEAEEYSPKRDFEVVCEVDARESDVVIIPHRRGDDGYFLAQITPPSVEGNWQREVLPDGNPLNVLLVCDTSASMDSESRSRQHQFVAAILSSLDSDDTFNISFCDVDCRWHWPQQQPATEEATRDAVDWISGRRSLGWTDLDRMTKSVLNRLERQSEQQTASSATHVIYVGDGIATARDADPQAFVNRVKRMAAERDGGTFHAVSVSSSFESAVLKAIASLGGGSVRQIDGEMTPLRTAHELLNEIAQPGLTDIQVEFKGLQVAAVYPEELPNLAAGTQQILAGRFLPTGENQSGEIIITGNRNGERVRYVSRVTMQDAENGNSFIPRLWARAHLEHLLEQGAADFIRDEIVALSEEFHIMTPYTSLLVLESDADRERFGVQRRFLMRDGEKFFADGRSAARFELLQKQMKAAGDWRLALRRRILQSLVGLGRNAQLFAPHSPYNEYLTVSGVAQYGGFGGGGGMGGFEGGLKSREITRRSLSQSVRGETAARLLSEDESGAFDEGGAPLVAESGESDKSAELDDFDEVSLEEMEESDAKKDSANKDILFDGLQDGRRGVAAKRKAVLDLVGLESRVQSASGRFGGMYMANGAFDMGRHWSYQNYTSWINELYPALSSQSAADAPVHTWAKEALELAERLLQPADPGDGNGLHVTLSMASFNPAWSRQTYEGTTHHYSLSDRWMTTSASSGSPEMVNWSTDRQRGVLNKAYRLGRTRTAVDADVAGFHPGERPHATRLLASVYPTHKPEIKADGDDRVVLTLTQTQQQNVHVYRLTIDTNRNVILRSESISNGKVSSATEYSEYLQVAGAWWPRLVVTRDSEGRVSSRTRQSVEVVNVARIQNVMNELLPSDEDLMIEQPLPTLKEARAAARNGSAGYVEHLVLFLDSCGIQDWEEAERQLQKAEAAAGDRDGNSWIRQRYLTVSRRNEESRQLLTTLVDGFLSQESASDYFLASYAMNQASGWNANERQTLLTALRPVYDRQPETAGAVRSWTSQQIQILSSLGKVDDQLALQRSFAESGPWDVSAQTGFAQRLAQSGEYEAALAWLEKALNHPLRKAVAERDSIRYSASQLLWNRSDFNRLIPYLKAWIDEAPDRSQAYNQYLSALLHANRVDELHGIINTWLTEARREEKLTGTELARLQAAIRFIIGQRYRGYQSWMDARWQKPLLETAVFFMNHRHHADIPAMFMTHHFFSQTDAAWDAYRHAAATLKQSVAEIPPANLANLLAWSLNRDILTEEDVDTIAATLQHRWSDAEDADAVDLLGQAVLTALAVHHYDTRHLEFMKRRIVRAKEEQDVARIASLTSALFESLLTRKWAESSETLAFEQLTEISAAKDHGQRLKAQLHGLLRLVDQMIARRIEHDERVLQADGHPEKLTRRELSAKKAEFRRTARAALVSRLTEEIRRRTAESDQDPTRRMLAAWMEIERQHYSILTAEGDAEVLAAAGDYCRRVLGDVPVIPEKFTPDKRPDTYQVSERIFSDLLKERALVMIQNLAVRRSAPAQLVSDVLSYIDAGVALDDADESSGWKAKQTRILIALDRPETLEKNLRQWIADDSEPTAHQLVLAWLVAERGRIQEAIALVESVERTVNPGPANYAALANWYLVRDDHAGYQRARVEVFKSMEEWKIDNWINGRRSRWTRSDRPLPTELDENVLFAFQALFEKSQNPESYVYRLRNYYVACRDFRLLQMVPDITTGRTPQQIYRILQTVQDYIMQELHNEATADSMMTHLQEVRSAAKTAVDRRALDLLEAMIERRSSMVLNQPGPHVAAAVAALKRAFEHEWHEGEVVQMASFLAHMRTIKQPELAAERLRQMKVLHGMTRPGTDDHFRVSWQLAHALHYSHSKTREAIVVMESALNAVRPSYPDGMPNHLNGTLDRFLDLLESQKQYGRSEAIILRELETPVNAAQGFWFRKRLHKCYLTTFNGKGQVSLGTGATLYSNLLALLIAEADSVDDSYRYHCITQVNSLLRAAHHHRIAASAMDARSWAFRQLPGLLLPHMSNYRNVISDTTSVVETVLGKRAALHFLIERVENYPARFEYGYENAWRQYGHRMEELRTNAGGGLKDLEPRLLKIVLKGLRSDLVSLQHYGRAMADRDSSYFWAAKENDFRRLADEVAEEYESSGQILVHVARFLHGDLHHRDRAIAILMDAHERDVLNTAQQITLTDYLHAASRYGESIPILVPINRLHPAQMAYRTRLITAYGRSSRPKRRDEFLQETESYFRDNRLWTENNIALLASTVLELKLFAKSAALYEEVIPMHQRTAARQGIGNGTLANYYSQLARAWSGLGNTVKAVDAAAGGVVAWGNRTSQRSNQLYWLKYVLEQAKDLDDFIVHLDEQAEKNGEDSALIRKTIGRIYLERSKYGQAISQMEIALELSPTDSAIHQALILCHDQLKQPEEAVSLMLLQLDFDRHNLALYRSIADRLKEDEAEGERAATTLVEAAPLEAEHHQALAEFREKQERWADAIIHWEHVARLRALEPTGLIHLAEAQIAAKQWEDARGSISKLSGRDWPERFREVPNEITRLTNQLP